MWENLYRKFIALFQSNFGVGASAYAGRCSGYDDGTCWKRCALRQKAHQLAHAEDEVTIQSVSARTKESKGFKTYSVPQFCLTSPFFKPRIWRVDGSGTSDFDTMVGPIAIRSTCVFGYPCIPYRSDMSHRTLSKSTIAFVQTGCLCLRYRYTLYSRVHNRERRLPIHFYRFCLARLLVRIRNRQSRFPG